MGFSTNANAGGNAYNFRYSAFLGMLYLSDDNSTKAIEDMKGQISDEDIRKGFSGTSANSPTGKARNILKGHGVTPITEIKGNLSSVFIREVEISNSSQKAPYLNVVLRDSDGTYYISAPLTGASARGAQMLARKLFNAEIGVETSLNLFAGQEKGQGQHAGKMFASHGGSLVQNGKQVQGVDIAVLSAKIQGAMDALEKANISDSKVKNTQRNAVNEQYHVELMKQLEQRIDEHYKALGQSRDGESSSQNSSESSSSNAQQSAPASAPMSQSKPAGNFDGFDDDIPF